MVRTCEHFLELSRGAGKEEMLGDLQLLLVAYFFISVVGHGCFLRSEARGDETKRPKKSKKGS